MITSKKLALAHAVSRLSSIQPLLRGEDSDGDEGDKPTMFTAEEVQAQIRTALDRETTGLKTKNQELLDEVKKVTKNAQKFEGVDLEGLQALKEKIENDDILKLMSEGKHSEAIEAATEKLKVTHQAELDGLMTQLTELSEGSKKDRELVSQLLIDGGAKAALIEAGGRKEATDDIALRARTVWKVENGEPVARDSEGHMIQGEKGPLTMTEWVESLKKTAPHWFPSSKGGDLSGGDVDDVTGDDLDNQIIAASKKQDFGQLRKLRDERNKRQRG